jgi:glyoxylase-like metal-dependent hydrolase (beta-lactamase superfamily II)
VTAGHAALLVDTGRTSAWPLIHNALNAAHLASDAPLLVVLTHTHFDHAENAARLKAECAATLIVHETEADFLRQGDSLLPAGALPLSSLLFRLFGKTMQHRVRYAPVDPDLLVQDSLDLQPHGLDVSLIHTPGHSVGSMSVLVGNEIAIVGDAMVGLWPGATFPPYADDRSQVLQSWAKLLETSAEVFLPSHGSERTRAVLIKNLERRTKP